MKMILTFCCLFSLSMACFADAAVPKRPATWPILVNGFVFTNIELAFTPDEQAKGLMDRDFLSEDGGMMFVFPSCEPRSFWMKNCRFDIDIAFMDSHGVIVAIHHMVQPAAQKPGESPFDYERRLPLYDSIKPAQFALELAAGQLDLLGLKPGDILPIRPEELIALQKRFGSAPSRLLLK